MTPEPGAAQGSVVDLTACEREPIHLPGSIQPHGMLFLLHESELTVQVVSANVTDLLELTSDAILGKPLDALLPEAALALRQRSEAQPLEASPLYLCTLSLSIHGQPQPFHAIAHRNNAGLILELEVAASAQELSFQDLHARIRTSIHALQHAPTVVGLAQVVAQEVRRITGFDRALVYQFDGDGNGTVIAEDRNDALPSYLDLRFPASDIPAQARQLYRLNPIRLIADASYTPVPLVPQVHPQTGQPIDLSFATLRSVSPVHIEYMKNMGTAASMSISILRDEQLWGLISCHHAAPRLVPFEVRTACEYLGQVLSLQLTSREHRADYEQRMQLQAVQNRLLPAMAREESFIEGLRQQSADLLALVAAHGAAIVHKGQHLLLGRTPEAEQIDALVSWLTGRDVEVFATDALASLFPQAEGFKDQASGLLAISISRLHQSYILWFRPEMIQTVRWGGDPRQPARAGENPTRLHPRKSFETWKEVVRLRSMPWKKSECDAAAQLRNAVVGLVLRKAEEMEQLNAQLESSNRELEAFSYSVSHDLRAPLRHIRGYAELLRESEGAGLSESGQRYLQTILTAARLAGELVDHLLAFSRIGRTDLQPMALDMNSLLAEVLRDVQAEAAGRDIDWKLHPLPVVRADPIMMRLVLRNLLDNAAKYTRSRAQAVIEVGWQEGAGEFVFFVRDNGVGFDMAYARKLFGVFQRLHRLDEFEGTGIGLATVRRIISRHGGRTWAEGMVDQGATFSFSLPHPPTPEPDHAQANPAGRGQSQ